MAHRKTHRKHTGAQQAPQLPDRRLMERQLAALEKELAKHDFTSDEEMNDFIKETVTSGELPTFTPETPAEQAQELVYQAVEATGKRRVELARQALEVWPDSADAYVLLAEATRDPAKARPLYEQGVQAGERALGPRAFVEDVGRFWGIRQTRPYMRARQGLAEVLWVLGERQAAIKHLQDMLRLNPDDNQGLRHILTVWLLTVGDEPAASLLLAQYPEEMTAHWAYNNALATFQRRGQGNQADEALAKALIANYHVPLYMLGLVEPPREMPTFYGLGDESEAILYVAQAAEAWLETPEALDWLAGFLLRIPGLAEPPKGRGPRRKR